jgi:serine phosphatase RsbU (regulator of sigma subunit)
VFEPKDILHHLNDQLNFALHQEQQKTGSGGIDLALVRLERTSNNQVEIAFAGAKRPLYYWHEGELHEVKGNRRSIGGFNKEWEGYVQANIMVPSGTILYMGSDGFADQNDAKRKSYGHGRLKELLARIAHLDFRSQLAKLEEVLSQQMEGTEQRDDILWMGIKV